MLRETGRKFSNAKEPACTITPVPSHILLRFYGTLSLSVQFLFGCSFVPPQKEEAQAQVTDEAHFQEWYEGWQDNAAKLLGS